MNRKPAESVAGVARRVKDAKANGEREYAAALRDALHLYEDAIAMGVAGNDLRTLRRLGTTAFVELGGQAEPPARSLKDYDSDRFGPYLGVSGSHTAGPAIRQAALDSAKVKSLGLTDPLEVGVAHDAERLGSIGELPVGPDEYCEIRIEGMGRILTSTNVGSRVNLRYFGTVKVVWVNPAGSSKMLTSAIESCRKRFEPFLRTPDGQPREAKVHLQFRGAVSSRSRLGVLRGLVAEIAKGEIASPAHHKVVLLARARKGAAGVRDALGALRLAQEAGVGEVAIDGTVRTASADVISNPWLLQYYSPAELNRLLAEFDAAGVRLSTKYVVDTGSVARQLWASLNTARSMGLELGKYGLFPLTVDEAGEVIAMVQGWFGRWTAAPAFYIDVPVVLRDSVLPTRDVARGVKVWLDMVARHRVSVVLIDTVFKSTGGHLLKTDAKDTNGFFTLNEIQDVDRHARALGIHALWAGGINLAQAYELGRIGVFGLYVTSAVAARKAVGPEQSDDPALAFEREPTASGVARVKLLIEAGFLAGRLASSEGRQRVEGLGTALLSSSKADASIESRLRQEVEAAWRARRRLRA